MPHRISIVVADITTLALDLGFSSHSHFTTAFKAFARQTPSAFRSTFRSRSYGAIRRFAPPVSDKVCDTAPKPVARDGGRGTGLGDAGMRVPA